MVLPVFLFATSKTENAEMQPIVGENDGPEWSRSAVQRSISFHGHGTIRVYKMNRDGGRANIQNALLNSAPVEDVFRPAILNAREPR
jgi:hypothetical protein